MDPSIASEPFLLTDTPHSKIRKAGFPLDCISLDLKTGKYYYDMPKEELEQLAVEDGVLAFFEGVKKYFEIYAMVTGTLAFKVSLLV